MALEKGLESHSHLGLVERLRPLWSNGTNLSPRLARLRRKGHRRLAEKELCRTILALPLQ